MLSERSTRRRGVHGRNVASLGHMDSYTPGVRASIAEATTQRLEPFETLEGFRRGSYTVTRDGQLYFISWLA